MFLKAIGTLLIGSWLWGAGNERELAFPGIGYDPAVVRMIDVTGFEIGERITMHHEALAYARALARSSAKVSIEIRGETWEGRKMALLLVTSAANQARLETLRSRYQAIADPGATDQASFDSMSADLPVLILLQESVHGNEISGTDSGLLLAHHLAAAKNNGEIDRVLDQAVIAIELMQNPDGRDRFVSHARQTRSPGGDPDFRAAEHDEAWPSGRFNHYLFDMNRDWFAMTQPETQTKVASFLEWRPQVVVDLHEMGSESSFFAANPSPPANPLLPQSMLDAYRAFGKAIGAAFDERGLDYFHGEIFDSFYPGYGESWPSLHGAVGVLFEQAGTRGLRYERRDGSLLTYHDAVSHHAIASYALIRHAAEHRGEMLKSFYQYRKSAMNEVKEDREILLFPGKDPARSVDLGRLLQRQGIEVEQLTKTVRSLSIKEFFKAPFKKSEIPEGSLVIRLNQPAGRLARSLLVERLDMGEDFIKEQLEREKKRMRPRIYDITGWSLPMLYAVPSAYTSASGWRENATTELAVPYQFHKPEAALGFLVPYTYKIGAVIADLLGRGIRLSYSQKPILHQGHDLPRGSLVIRRKGNPDDLSTVLQQVSETHEITVIGTDTAWFESGPSFGSVEIPPILPPKICLLWDIPTRPMSAGWARFILEHEFGYPVTVMKAASLADYSIYDFKVILMPEGSLRGWRRVLGDGGAAKLSGWVRRGGVLIGLGSTTEWFMDEKVRLLHTERENRDGTVGDQKAGEEPSAKPETDPDKMILPRRERPQEAQGALLRVAFDTEHWMAFGMLEEQAVMVDSNRILRPLRLDKGRNPGRFVKREDLLMSGFVPEETLAQFAHKPFLMVRNHGRGLVIAFTEDPNYRAFMKGLLPLMSNAIFFGPSQTSR